FQAQEKEYTGTLVLGKTTPSVDLETDFNAEFPTEHITDEQIIKNTQNFLGEIQQVPPVYSAINIDGKRAYTQARQGKTEADLAIKARTVSITEFEITNIEMPQVSFRIICSKGTYIRSLVRDFGTALQSGAYLSALCRTRIGDYTLENAKSVEAFVANLPKTER
ncbi:MAG: tRNA pseudouridine(55) synthase, partial [Verrucomicrobia bacterium]|nr:tRNA pseudouridine(55) synthase [Cytophagales bacterium]